MEASANAFFGTSAFAVEVLRVLAASAHRPRLVVTPPDRPRGRGRRLRRPPVAEAALELGIELHQTADVNEPGSLDLLRGAGLGWGCVCAFGQLIREPLLSELPMLNVHPSLLPRWRGAAPIERALMAGDRETGVCVMRLTAGLDSGPIARCEKVAIEPGSSYGELAPRLARLGGELLVAALDDAAAGALELDQQSEEGATYAEKVEPAERRLDPRRPAAELASKVAALTPHIGAYLELEGGERLGVRVAGAVASDLAPGALAVSDDRLLVGCGDGALAIERLQPAGRREMASADWLRGHSPPDRLPLPAEPE